MHWGRRQVTGHHQHSLHYHIKLQRHVQFFSKHSQLFFLKIFFFFTTLLIFLSKGNKSVCCSLEFFSWTELCFVIIPSLFRLFLLSPRFFFLSVPDKNYCCAKRHLQPKQIGEYCSAALTRKNDRFPVKGHIVCSNDFFIYYQPHPRNLKRILFIAGLSSVVYQKYLQKFAPSAVIKCANTIFQSQSCDYYNTNLSVRNCEN